MTKTLMQKQTLIWQPNDPICFWNTKFKILLVNLLRHILTKVINFCWTVLYFCKGTARKNVKINAWIFFKNLYVWMRLTTKILSVEANCINTSRLSSAPISNLKKNLLSCHPDYQGIHLWSCSGRFICLLFSKLHLSKYWLVYC